MLTKKNVLQSINELPDHFSMDQLLDRVLSLQKKTQDEASLADNDLSLALEKKKIKNALVFKRKSF
jgi:hypothetical protein